jgi:hypothetical protein
MTRHVGLLLAVLGFFSLPGCMTGRNVRPPAAVGKEIYVGLEPSQYEVVGDAAASQSGGLIFFIPYGDDPAEPVKIEGTRILDGSMMAAVARALEASPGADAILEPLIQQSSFSILLYTSWKVTVVGKAIKVRAEKSAPKP